MEWSNVKMQGFYSNKNFATNHDGPKPLYIEIPALNTHLMITSKGNKTITITVGESWTYGESLPGISTASDKFDAVSQFNGCFGPKLANLFKSDFLQYAVPGNNNYYIVKEIPRLINYAFDRGYKKINLCVQLTESSREYPYIQELVNHHHSLRFLFDKQHLARDKITFEQWLERYDRIFYEEIDSYVQPYGDKINTLVWKNFCRINDHTEYSFKKVEESWIKFSARYHGIDLDMPSFYMAKWLDDFMKAYPSITFNPKYVKKELEKIQASNDYLAMSPGHVPHPNNEMHSLWALNLYERWTDAQ